MFPRSCKANCDLHTIEFILKDGKECPEVYESRNPPLDVMVSGHGISYHFGPVTIERRPFSFLFFWGGAKKWWKVF